MNEWNMKAVEKQKLGIEPLRLTKKIKANNGASDYNFKTRKLGFEPLISIIFSIS